MKGAKGEMGDHGLSGSVGLTGPKGKKGQPGACIKGPMGNAAPPGQPGIDGQQGDNGNRGPTGQPGDNRPILSLSLIYRLQTTIDIVRHKISKCCSGLRVTRDTKTLIMPVNEQPPRHDVPQLQEDSQTSRSPRQSRCYCYRGPPGSPGAPGAKGDTGVRGYTGSTGMPGARGPTGDKGSIGPTGPIGQKGTQGRDYGRFCLGMGLPGMKGDKGDRGYRGPQGHTGRPGLPGDACISSHGPRGNTGEPGLPGRNGDKGQKGNPGAKGQKGDMAQGDITEQTYEKYLEILQEIIEKVESGKCCAQKTCTYNGAVYQQGEQIKPNCTTKCTCQNRQWVCSRTQCFNGVTCYASGDPHYSTFMEGVMIFKGYVNMF